MDLEKILDNLKDCPCGKKHTFDLKVYRCDRGLVNKVGEILAAARFPKKILVVSDKNAMNAADGILKSLDDAGFRYEKMIYEDVRFSYFDDATDISKRASEFGGVLSVGTGSVNDICRYAAFDAGKEFAIFATAPSMDGFASDSSPLIKDNFKISYLVKQPSVVIADSDILAASPAELKSAGYGDMIAKYIAIVDWKVANYTIGEYYCEGIVDLVRQALAKVVDLTDKITKNDPDSCRAIMDGLILTGCAMQLAGCTRPASGCEHVISHYLEIHKLEKGIWPDFHGKKVGVATYLVAKIYHRLAQIEQINPTPDKTDLGEVLKNYSPCFEKEVIKMNTPPVTDKVDLSQLKERWGDICIAIKEEIPSIQKLYSLMKIAGCATDIEDVDVSYEMYKKAIKYSPYMRYRITLLRIIDMLGIQDFNLYE